MMETAKLPGRSLLTLDQLSTGEMLHLLDLADELKVRKRSGVRGKLLEGKTIALLFQKASTRTRCAALAAATDESGHAEHLGAKDIHLGQKESVADTARVLGRMFDGILFRGYEQATVATLAEYAGVPVWNGLTDEAHPTQALADLQTIRENHGTLAGVRLAYLGNGRNNVANSIMLGCAKAGLHYVCASPPGFSPAPELVDHASAVADENGGRVEVTTDPAEAVTGAQVVYTDVWISMGEEGALEERLAALKPYPGTMDLMKKTGNLDDGVIFLHCLPAFHDNNTEFSRERGPMEVTDEVFEAAFSKVFDLAENRVHTLKAVMVATLK